MDFKEWSRAIREAGGRSLPPGDPGKSRACAPSSQTGLLPRSPLARRRSVFVLFSPSSDWMTTTMLGGGTTMIYVLISPKNTLHRNTQNNV